ncbi:hypothetical protein K503DRAFT_864101 [Rhizopogon vinicolor AM-OR11-026]|uniref:GDP/GTP exchange factor Sec2 N-terminal domain-containing protein n=1 Tax=Rhizopogon vinicolor AM-OR11-026 TaxID=1314800 RepID=A0A1B7N8H8_9AGAM|nr:hypothetical protein K503DRAFT_864101 [Rhizopogon vinicolor AM-OR11-026]
MLSNLTFGSPNVQTRIPSSRSSVQESHLSPTSAVFANIDDELHDARRVHSHGQEEDLRYALDRVIKRVEELSSLLKSAYKTHTELETSLSVAKSNLQLMMSNNEMLEEALKRDTPCSAKDVGWRRWSAREAQSMQRLSEEERSRSFDYGPLNESGVPSHPTNAPTVVVNDTQPSRPSTPSESPAPPSTTSQSNQEGRFFRFRFNNGIRSPAVQQHASHLTSPSLPTLVASSREKELLELQEQLERERRAHEVAITEKATLEAELESLSQALFEEANKMVATERVKRAETEEELQEVRLEKDALKEALRLIEGENGQLRLGSAQLSTGGISNHTAQQSYSHSRSSSRDAIKSPPPSSLSLSLPPSPPSNPDDIAVLALQPSAASFSTENPDHLADFLLQPAPKTTFTTLHQKSRTKEEVISNASGNNSLYIPDEPSPWA